MDFYLTTAIVILVTFPSIRLIGSILTTREISILSKGICSFIVLSASVAMAQLPPPSPIVRPFGDNRQWIVSEDIAYRIGDTADFINVPKGFVTDFASIPQPLWSFGLSPHGQYSRAAIIHDYLYWTQACTRAQADRLMVIAMKESNVGRFDETLIYSGVNMGGNTSWERNAAERAAGLPRIIPSEYIKPYDPNISWLAYREFLIDLKVRDPEFEPTPKYCQYGESTEVPQTTSSTSRVGN